MNLWSVGDALITESKWPGLVQLLMKQLFIELNMDKKLNEVLDFYVMKFHFLGGENKVSLLTHNQLPAAPLQL